MKHRQREGTERLSEIEKRESRLPENALLTGTLEHVNRHSTDHLVSERGETLGSHSEVFKGDRLKEKGSQCCPTLQRTDREAISWSGRPIEFQNEREGNRLLFDPMVGHILVPQLLGKNEKMVKCCMPWLEGCCEVVDNDVVMLQVNQHRLRPRFFSCIAGLVRDLVGQQLE